MKLELNFKNNEMGVVYFFEKEKILYFCLWCKGYLRVEFFGVNVVVCCEVK